MTPTAEAVYTVTGMSCEHCVRAVTEEVGRIEGVTDVTVDLATGKVTVTSTREVPVEDLRVAVDEAGYELAG